MTDVKPERIVSANTKIFYYKDAWYVDALFPSLEKFDRIKNLKLRQDDVIVASFPKSGTTWLQEIVHQIMTSVGALPSDGELGNLNEWFPYVESPYLGLEMIDQMKSPRFLKTHVPFHMLPTEALNGTCKMLYIARNVRDICVSMFYFYRSMTHMSFTGNFDEFFDSFINGTVSYGPWADHVTSYWHHRNDENMMFLTYEQLHENPRNATERIVEFLGVQLTDEQLSTIVQQTSFQVMKDNPKVNSSWLLDRGIYSRDGAPFIRKGIVGDWKNHMTDGQARRIAAVCEEPLKRHGLLFTCE